MSRSWVPVRWFPAGLITWYAAGGRAMALVTGWMAMTCGAEPQLRAAWSGEQACGEHFWPGGDFVLNVPDLDCLEQVQHRVSDGPACFDVISDLGLTVVPGVLARAPRVSSCALQIECRYAHIVADRFDPEIIGKVVLLHRGELTIDLAEVADVCTLQPFNPQLDVLTTA